MQNAKSKTIAAPYVLRAYSGAPVATPLEWGEVRPGLHPEQFNITNAPERFAGKGDLFAGGGQDEKARAALHLQGTWDDPIVVASD